MIKPVFVLDLKHPKILVEQEFETLSCFEFPKVFSCVA